MSELIMFVFAIFSFSEGGYFIVGIFSLLGIIVTNSLKWITMIAVSFFWIYQGHLAIGIIPIVLFLVSLIIVYSRDNNSFNLEKVINENRINLVINDKYFYPIKIAFYSITILITLVVFGYFAYINIPSRIIIALFYVAIYIWLRNYLLRYMKSKVKIFIALFLALILTIFTEFYNAVMQYYFIGESYFRGLIFLFAVIYLYSFYGLYKIKIHR